MIDNDRKLIEKSQIFTLLLRMGDAVVLICCRLNDFNFLNSEIVSVSSVSYRCHFSITGCQNARTATMPTLAQSRIKYRLSQLLLSTRQNKMTKFQNYLNLKYVFTSNDTRISRNHCAYS